MPTAYRVDWTAAAWRNLLPLPEKVATAVVEFTQGALPESPRRVGHALHLELAGHHSARRGSFRVRPKLFTSCHWQAVLDATERAARRCKGALRF